MYQQNSISRQSYQLILKFLHVRTNHSFHKPDTKLISGCGHCSKQQYTVSGINQIADPIVADNRKRDVGHVKWSEITGRHIHHCLTTSQFGGFSRNCLPQRRRRLYLIARTKLKMSQKDDSSAESFFCPQGAGCDAIQMNACVRVLCR